VIPTLTAGTTTSTAATITSGTITNLASTTGTIATLNSTTGTIGNLSTTLAGDFTISSGTGTLGTTGVTAGTYGSASAIPFITVDAKGRITSATSGTFSTIPAGAVMAFAMNSAPSGWLSADGSEVSRTTYATLFTAIGTTHGTGDGSTTFNVPNLQGIFVRGSGSQTISGTSYSGTFAAKQQDELKSHKHQSWEQLTNTSGQLQCAQSTQAGTGKTAASSTNANFETANTGGTETCPANIALFYCVKT
jgi:microcystin-dependent protein